MYDPEADMDGVGLKAYKIVYRVALYAEMSQDRNTVKIEAPTEEQALHRLRSMYPPDCVDIVSVSEEGGVSPEETAELYAKMGEALDKIDLTPHGRMGFQANAQFISFAKALNMTVQELFDTLVEDLK